MTRHRIYTPQIELKSRTAKNLLFEFGTRPGAMVLRERSLPQVHDPAKPALKMITEIEGIKRHKN